MSKLLAMMMKPKNYMYATIKGSLTESPAGVFSGFSASKYLLIDQTFSLTNNDIEFVFDVFLPTDNTKANACFFSFSPDNKRVQFYRSSVSLNYFVINIAGQSGSGTHQYSLNSNHRIKTVISATTVKIYYYDNNQWNFDVEYNISNSSISTVRIGNSQTGDRYFYGSINLNSSYAKIGNTKYNLQAVVGYTIVGSPTIVDGVVSGFSGSNYLKITQSVSLGNNFEIKTKVVTGSDVTSQRVIFSGLTGQYINFSIQNEKTQQNIGNGTSWEITQSSQTVGKTTIATNTTYYLRFTFDGSAYRLYLSTDNINWILDWKYESVNVIPSCQYVWGVSRSLSAVFNGSIDIANSYIKQNNKLWFNGQPAS